MKLVDAIASEFEHEVRTTRRHLERVPEAKFDWQPHHKSFSLGGLASHIVDCVGWADSIFSRDEIDINPATHTSFAATSAADLLEAFDGRVADGTRALASASDAELMQAWRLLVKGRVRIERPKGVVFRDFVLSHLIHHRGQLSVYLRLLDVPVPGSYGPTADETF
jgi:uncharacterized damage-inducible protein DinB